MTPYMNWKLFTGLVLFDVSSQMMMLSAENKSDISLIAFHIVSYTIKKYSSLTEH